MAELPTGTVAEEFFPVRVGQDGSTTRVMPESRIRPNCLCNLGCGNAAGLSPRNPRLRSTS